ncbi:MAG: hypothetical protein FJ253_04260, partial [Phycisphaerae bacterium]|nr:hypothetical protein [Phycisphaerae bacterium]
MRRARRALWWTAFGAGSAAVAAGLAWISTQVIRLDREETMARAAIAQQETLHLALWRMDSWLAPLLARESARTWFEYQSYYPETLALNRLCEPLAPGEVVVPSPLLAFRSELFTLHVQFTDEAGFTSPQVPSPQIVASGVVGCVPTVPDPTIEQRLRFFALENDGTTLLDHVESCERALLAEGSNGASGATTWTVPSPDSLNRAVGATSARDGGGGAGAGAGEPSVVTQAPVPVDANDKAHAVQRAAPIESKWQARDVWDNRKRNIQQESEAEFEARK